MKGGVFDIAGPFVKIIAAAYVALILLSIFFAINRYYLIFLENRRQRETLLIADTILSSCIAENAGGYPAKGLLSEEKINGPNPLSCLSYDKKIYVEIYKNKNLLYAIGDSTFTSTPINATLPAALNRTSEIIPVILKVCVSV